MLVTMSGLFNVNRKVPGSLDVIHLRSLSLQTAWPQLPPSFLLPHGLSKRIFLLWISHLSGREENRIILVEKNPPAAKINPFMLVKQWVGPK